MFFKLLVKKNDSAKYSHVVNMNMKKQMNEFRTKIGGSFALDLIKVLDAKRMQITG